MSDTTSPGGREKEGVCASLTAHLGYSYTPHLLG